jgi:hypothetical protein
MTILIPESDVPPDEQNPYIVTIGFKLGSNVEMTMLSDAVRVEFGNDRLLVIRREIDFPSDTDNDRKRFSISLGTFVAGEEAAEAGEKLTAALLWVAVTRRITIQIERTEDDRYYNVHRRYIVHEPNLLANLRVHTTITTDEFYEYIQEGFHAKISPSPSLLASMEFYASARIEFSERSKFIGLMTALEALSDQAHLGPQVESVLNRLAKELEAAPELAGKSPEAERIRSSLSNRMRELKRESVRQAIRRVVRNNIKPEELKTTLAFIDEAYKVRSSMLHDGTEHPKIANWSYNLECVLRDVYAAIFDRTLKDGRGQIPLDANVFTY